MDTQTQDQANLGAPSEPQNVEVDSLEPTGFSHGAYSTNQSRLGGYSQRHPRRQNISINTANHFMPGRPTPSEQTAPGTAFEMNFTPLLPSQLLLGSPFQPGTPHFGNFHPVQHQTLSQMASPITHVSTQQGFPTQLYEQHLMHSPQSPASAAFGALPNGQYINDHQLQVASTMSHAGIRTIYLGNIPPETSAEELLSHVRSGQIESVKIVPDKNCAFISFLDSSSATHFHSDAILKKLAVRGQDIKVGWGKPSPVPAAVAVAVQHSGASRNVYLGNLPDSITEAEIREDLGKFGGIDTIKLVREKAIGFVHFLSIGNAIKAVAQLPQEPKWQAPRRVYYGRDRCAYVSKTQQQNAAQYLGIAPGYAHMLNSADRDLISNALAQQSVAAAAVATQAGGVSNLGNRTVYLGNIHPESTIEEICNVVRGGLLHHIKFIPEKHICFVTFIDPTSAASFFALSQVQGLMIHNRRLKIGWGKHSGALPPSIALAVSGGASRNVYIGNLDESWTEQRLRQDFSDYGEIELVNTLREKNCAFVNFTNIANAIKAIEAIRGKEDYGRFKVNFGKDRCGNAPRQSQQNHGYGQVSQLQQQQHHLPGHDSVTNSPSPLHMNGGYAHPMALAPQRGQSASPSARLTLSPPPESTSSQQGLGTTQHSQSHSQTPFRTHSPNGMPNHNHSTFVPTNQATNNNVHSLSLYLNQVSLNGGDKLDSQAQYGRQVGETDQNLLATDILVNGLHSAPAGSLGSGLGGSGIASGSFGHMASNSIHVTPEHLAFVSSGNGMSGSTTIGGLLAPGHNGTRSQQNQQQQQHSRAVSLPPAFSQEDKNRGQVRPAASDYNSMYSLQDQVYNQGSVYQTQMVDSPQALNAYSSLNGMRVNMNKGMGIDLGTAGPAGWNNQVQQQDVSDA